MIDNAKILNTRIILKNDTLANWNDSSLILQPGEVAFAKIESADNYGTPTYLMKVGDGVNTFSNLKWTAANAADVYSWAKSKEIKAAGTGNAVTGVSVVDNEDGTTSVVLNKEISFALASDLDNYTTTDDLVSLLDEYVTEDELTTTLAGYALKEHEHTVEDITDFDSAVKAYDYATKAEAQGYADAKVASVTAADKSVTIGGTATAPTVAAKISESADNALTLADDGLKVVIPAAAEYSIVKAENSGDYAAVYNLTKDGAIVGTSINIPKDLVVKSGSVVDDNIVLVLNDESETEIVIPASSLIEYVTSGSQTGDMVVINVDESTHKVTASITDGTITLAKLAVEVTDAITKAKTDAIADADGKIQALTDGAVKDNADAIDAINDELDTYGDIVTHNAAEFATADALATTNEELAKTNEEVAKKANDADLAAIAKTGSTDDLVQGSMVLVFDCGTSAE